MGIAERREGCLEKGLTNPDFVEALLSLVAELRQPYEARLHVERKSSLDEHVTSLLIGNGACVALDKIDFARLHGD